jgi:hypothetical protein
LIQHSCVGVLLRNFLTSFEQRYQNCSTRTALNKFHRRFSETLIRDSYKVAKPSAEKGKIFTDIKLVKTFIFSSVYAIGTEKIVKLQCIILLAPTLTSEKKIQ